MSVRKRNPILGGIMAAAFVGVGIYVLYLHYGMGQEMPTYRIVLGFGIVAYGLFLAYTVITQKNG